MACCRCCMSCSTQSEPLETHESGLQTSVAGWLEAFGAHPRIGDAAALKAKLGGFGQASRSEQAAASGAPEAVYQVYNAALFRKSCSSRALRCCLHWRDDHLPMSTFEDSSGIQLQELEQWNRQYEAKFGHVFLIFAAGKSADEVLAALKRR
jgi:OHCU decarboxylase